LLSKRQRKWVLIILVVILCLVFFRGFKIFIYDNDNELIGTSFEFNQEMVYTSNLPDIYAGKKIAKKYGSIITPNTRTWTSSIEYFPEIKLDEIGCAEQFTIVGAFSRIPVGLLERVFSEGTEKFFEVSSNEHPLTIIDREIYDRYAHESDFTEIRSEECRGLVR